MLKQENSCPYNYWSVTCRRVFLLGLSETLTVDFKQSSMLSFNIRGCVEAYISNINF